MAGGLPRAGGLEQWGRQLDDPGEHCPATRPAPVVPAELRPDVISVTEVDRLKADPFAFYARRVLGLAARDPVDADPSAAWRGTAVHASLESWAKEDDCAPDKLAARALAMMADARTHPLLRALWQPRLMEAVEWIAAEMAEQQARGRRVVAVEASGKAEIAGVTLTGKADRIDRFADGALGIVDYKTGKPPSSRAVAAGYSLQLGLIGAIAERGGFEGVVGEAAAFEYWSLGKKRDAFGYVESPVDRDGKYGKVPTAEFVALAVAQFGDAAAEWLTGDAPFTAKLHPEYAPYAEYDQLMRLDEWYGRG
jgi:ATP-dependent helicase/nuclease subunit B